MIRNKSLITTVLVFVVMLMIKNLDLSAQITTYAVSDPQQFSGKHGLFYSLPKIYFNIEVHVEKISRYRGPLSNYAFDYLGIERVINENSVSYELNDVILVPQSSPDPEHLYFIEYGVKEAKEERAIEFELTKNGFLVYSGINCPYNEEDFKVNETKDVGHIEVPPDEKELFPYFEEQRNPEECIQEIKKNTRNYAKRQITWYRKIDFDLTLQASNIKFSIILQKIREFIGSEGRVYHNL